jgi:hypothetical protein
VKNCIPKRAYCLLIAAIAAVILPVSAGSRSVPGESHKRGLRLTGSIGTGFDSFQERYSIVDRDTLDSVNEFRTRFGLGLVTGNFLRDYFLLEGFAQYGDDTYETSGRLRFTKLFGSRAASRIGVESEFTRRNFGDNSSYQFPNNYDRFFLRGYFKQNFNESFALRITDRLEHQNFEKRTDFDYDYLRNKFSLGAEYDWDLTTVLDTRLTVVTMDIPDSTEIEYRSLIPSLELRSFAGLFQRGYIQTAIERREYAAGSPRSDFWALLSVLSGEWPFGPNFSVRLENGFEWYVYDVKEEVYFDYVENRSVLLFKLNHSYELSIGAGPTFGFLNSDISAEDVYREYGVRFTADYNKGATAWLSASYEPGKRTYKAFSESQAGDELSLFSDYLYHRVSLFANFRLIGGITLSCFADYQPEDHKRADDDATATLFSISLFYFF